MKIGQFESIFRFFINDSIYFLNTSLFCYTDNYLNKNIKVSRATHIVKYVQQG